MLPLLKYDLAVPPFYHHGPEFETDLKEILYYYFSMFPPIVSVDFENFSQMWRVFRTALTVKRAYTSSFLPSFFPSFICVLLICDFRCTSLSRVGSKIRIKIGSSIFLFRGNFPDYGLVCSVTCDSRQQNCSASSTLLLAYICGTAIICHGFNRIPVFPFHRIAFS